MEPVKLRMYGFVLMTKRTYLVTQACGFAIMGMLLLACNTVLAPAAPLAVGIVETVPWTAVIFKYLPWAVVAVAVMEVAESVYFLRKFKFAERPPDRNRRG